MYLKQLRKQMLLQLGLSATVLPGLMGCSPAEKDTADPTDPLTVDDDGATVLTLDRATSNGTVIDIQKDGSTVGSIIAS